jgi:hypothetical protein
MRPKEKSSGRALCLHEASRESVALCVPQRRRPQARVVGPAGGIAGVSATGAALCVP